MKRERPQYYVKTDVKLRRIVGGTRLHTSSDLCLVGETAFQQEIENGKDLALPATKNEMYNKKSQRKGQFPNPQ